MLEKAVDAPSFKGQFGWERIGTDDLAVPVIVRTNGVRYSPVKIVEQEIIKKYDTLPQSVFQCITLKSFYLTSMEAKLLNEINFSHCNNRYGETFFCVKDVIISSTDVRELSRYLNISLEIFTKDISRIAPHFGIVRIQADPLNPNDTMMIPFITKLHRERLSRMVPHKFVEPFTKASAVTVVTSPNDWDIMYLKMLSAYCEHDIHQLITKEDKIILLDGLFYKKNNAPINYSDCMNLSRRNLNNIQ